MSLAYQLSSASGATRWHQPKPPKQPTKFWFYCPRCGMAKGFDKREQRNTFKTRHRPFLVTQTPHGTYERVRDPHGIFLRGYACKLTEYTREIKPTSAGISRTGKPLKTTTLSFFSRVDHDDDEQAAPHIEVKAEDVAPKQERSGWWQKSKSWLAAKVGSGKYGK